MHLMPLNSGGLCEAVTITARRAPTRGTLYWIAGVASKPRSITRWPAAASVPATT